MKKKQRKYPRLKNYDYSLARCYFITDCVKNMENLFSSVGIVGRDAHIQPYDSSYGAFIKNDDYRMKPIFNMAAVIL